MEKTGVLEYVASSMLKKWNIVDNQNKDEFKSKNKRKLSELNSCNDSFQFHVCDLGCNEGNLTTVIGDTLVNKLKSNQKDTSNNDSITPKFQIKSLGLDIDPILIERAQKKCGRKNDDEPKLISYLFQMCDVSVKTQYQKCCESFLNDSKRFHLTTIFSTTMWVHLHSGDEGLVDFLQRVCYLTDLLLIEPQPSKCYRKVNVRLRKLNLPEIDSVSELRMRENIESKIEEVIIGCGFSRVQTIQSNTEETMTNKTSWKRTLQLYRRVDLLY